MCASLRNAITRRPVMCSTAAAQVAPMLYSKCFRTSRMESKPRPCSVQPPPASLRLSPIGQISGTRNPGRYSG
jgi:hypothetical protein